MIFLHVAVFKVSPQARDQVVDIPVVVQTQIPMVRFTIEILQLQYFDQVVDILVVQVQQVRAQSWELVEIPLLQLVSPGQLLHARCVQRQVPSR